MSKFVVCVWEITKHKVIVFWYVLGFCLRLFWRGLTHDNTKYTRAEFWPYYRAYRKHRPSYGTPEYEEARKRMGDGLAHHYRVNRHHPEHFSEEGCRGMTLLDQVEMFLDWKASVLRHEDGDLGKSIDYNEGRFGMSDEVCQVFRNSM